MGILGVVRDHAVEVLNRLKNQRSETKLSETHSQVHQGGCSALSPAAKQPSEKYNSPVILHHTAKKDSPRSL